MRTVRAIAEALSDAGVQPEDLEVILGDQNKRLALLIALEHGHGADLGL